ncbi:MAG: flagellar basal body P-ring formation protein FlgA [Gammaproteobacteria bacterium]|nr:flagellar basal body P-ring formation protein FlgA [Gammaproteobacteria bacterium]
MRITFCCCLSLLAITFQSSNAFSDTAYSTTQKTPANKSNTEAQILEAVEEFSKNLTENQTYSRIETTLPRVDSRLRLRYCNTPLEVTSTSKRKKIGRFTLKVTCFDKKRWAIHVPLELKAYESVVVSTRHIPRGQTLTTSNITVEEREVSRLNQGYFSETPLALGSIATRRIPINKVIAPNFIAAPKMVKKGEVVSIQANTSGLSIKATGIALSAGGLGDLIQVKNSKTRRIVEGRVSAVGQVTINL